MSTDYTAAWMTLPTEVRDKLGTDVPLSDENLRALDAAGVSLDDGLLPQDFRDFAADQLEADAAAMGDPSIPRPAIPLMPGSPGPGPVLIREPSEESDLLRERAKRLRNGS
jgi:hypothetical protein